MKIKLRIKRQSPLEKEGATAYQLYTVDVSEGATILDALLKIYDEQDPTLSFRRSCRSAICGSCAMTINGASRLACSTQAIPEAKRAGEVTVEPLSNHRVLKDLIVDLTPFWRKMEKITPYLTPPKEGPARTKVTVEDTLAIDKSQQCIMCGCCNSECNSLEIDEHFLGPAALAKAWRFVGDVREGKRLKRLTRLSEEHGVWDCVRCVHCTEYCPKGVEPLKAIELLRASAIRHDITDNPGAKHVEAMVESVKKIGRLDEAAMTFKTLGFLRSLGMIPFGIKMELHGKMPLPHIFAQIKDIEEVRKIYEEMEKKRAEKMEEEGMG
jgi:succinate dehydrogenase / fumarate reductase iron-sulfur subunit